MKGYSIFMQFYFKSVKVKLLSAGVILALLSGNIAAYPQAVTNFPINNPYFLTASPPFVPALLKGIKVDPGDPFKFNFILDTGSDLTPQQIATEGKKLTKYFLAALAIPRKDLWVNLSPYEQDRIIPDATGQTNLGEALLTQDYLLKRLAASLTYPETEAGKKYWNEMNNVGANNYSPAAQSCNKVWIMPDYAEVHQEGNAAFITKARLKVMMEEDYVAGRFDTSRSLSAKRIETNGTLSDRGTQSFKAHILPLIEKEVNEGESFAPLRQVFYALTLALWYKENLKQTILNRQYADKSNVNGIDLADKVAKEKIYNQYSQAFKKGAYDYIKRERTAYKITKRRYFSGGFDVGTAPYIQSVPLGVPKPSGKWANLMMRIGIGVATALIIQADSFEVHTPDEQGVSAQGQGPLTPTRSEVNFSSGRKGQVFVIGYEHVPPLAVNSILNQLYPGKGDRVDDAQYQQQIAKLYADHGGRIAQARAVENKIVRLMSQHNITLLGVENPQESVSIKLRAVEGDYQLVRKTMWQHHVPDPEQTARDFIRYIYGPQIALSVWGRDKNNQQIIGIDERKSAKLNIQGIELTNKYHGRLMDWALQQEDKNPAVFAVVKWRELVDAISLYRRPTSGQINEVLGRFADAEVRLTAKIGLDIRTEFIAETEQRDHEMAEVIKDQSHDMIVVVGSAHTPGLTAYLQGKRMEVEPLVLPPDGGSVYVAPKKSEHTMIESSTVPDATGGVNMTKDFVRFSGTRPTTLVESGVNHAKDMALETFYPVVVGVGSLEDVREFFTLK